MRSLSGKVILLIVYFCAFTSLAFAQKAPPLGTARIYDALANKKVVNKKSRTEDAVLGALNGPVSGFSSNVLSQAPDVKNAAARQAMQDAQVAYDFAFNQKSQPASAGKKAFSPGAYKLDAGSVLSGVMSLDGAGTYIFQVPGDLTISDNASLNYPKNISAENIFWVVEGNLKIGSGANVSGTFISKGEISLAEKAKLRGRVISLEDQIVMSQARVNIVSDMAVTIALTPSASGTESYLNNEETTITINVVNNGPANDDGVIVKNISFSGELISSSSTAFNPQRGEWKIGELKKGDTASLTLRVKLNSAGLGVARASVEGNNIDEDLTNNTASTTYCVLLPSTGNISGATEVCAGQTYEYTVQAVNGATRYTWSVPTGWTFVQVSPTRIRVTPAVNSGQVSVQTSNICGESPAQTLDVASTGAIPPKPTLAGPANVCSGDTGVKYKASDASGTTSFNWVVPAGWEITNGQGTSEITVTVGSASGSVSVEGVNVCGTGEVTAFAVTVEQAVPTVGAIRGPQTFCVGNSVSFEIDPVAGATAYTWTVPADWTITGGQNSEIITVTVGAASGDISVSVDNTCGTSEPSKLAVNPTTNPPAQPGAITGASDVCENQQGVTYTIDAVAGADSYEWTVPTGWTITGGQGSVSITVGAGSTGGQVSVAATNVCGTGTARTLAVQTTNMTPAQPGAITGPKTVCAGSSATYSVGAVAGADSYNWTVPAGWIITNQSNESITVTVGSESGQISVAGVNACGEGPASATTVTTQGSVPAAPTPVSGSTEVCQGTTDLIYSITPVAGVSYDWTVPAGWAITDGQGTASIKVTAGNTSGSVSVTGTNTCGTGDATSFNVNVINSVPDAPASINGADKVCASQENVTYTAASVTGANSYTWAVPAGWTIVSGQGSRIVTVNSGNAGGTISVTAENICGASTPATLAVQVSQAAPAQPGNITGDQVVCEGSEETYTISAVTDANSYTWTVPTGWTIKSGQGSTTLVVTAGAESGNITVVASNACGDSDAASLAITSQNSVPMAPAAIKGTATICKNTTGLTYSIDPIAGATSYTWSVPTDWTIVSGQGTATITVDAGTDSGNVSVSATNACGTGDATSLAINVTANPPAQPSAITGASDVCENQQGVTYTIDAVAGADSYEWTVPTGWTITGGQGSISITVDAGSNGGQVSVAATNVCGTGTARTLAVQTTGAAPTRPTITGPLSVCADATNIRFTATGSTGADSYVWTVPAGWTITDGRGTAEIIVTVGQESGQVSVAGVNACGEGELGSVSVLVEQAVPTVGAIKAPAEYCAGSSVDFEVDAVNGATAYNWTVPAGWSITGGQNTNKITVTVGATAGEVSVTVNNSCGSSAPSTLQVNPTTTVPAQPGNIQGAENVCVNQQNVTYRIEDMPDASSYTWTVPTGWTIISGQGKAVITVNAGNTDGQISVSAVNACGNGTPSTFNVQVTTEVPGQPGAITGLTTVCAGSSQTYTVGTITGAESYNWTVPAGWVITNQSNESITVTVGANSGEVTVAGVNACGQGATSSLAVTSQSNAPSAPASINGSTEVCQGTTDLIYSVTPVAGVSYDWTVPAGWAITDGQGTASIKVTAGNTSGSVSVTGTNTCGTSDATSVNVNVVTAPPAQPDAITGLATVCASQPNITYTILAVTGATSYTWSIPTGWAVVSGQGTRSITVNAGSVGGTISVVANNICGPGTAREFTVAVESSVPAKPSAIDGTLNPCVGNEYTYSINPVAGAVRYSWNLPTGWSISENNGISVKVIVGGTAGDVSVTASNSCGSSEASILAVTPTSEAPTGLASVEGEAIACKGNTLTYSVNASPNANSYNWTIPADWTITSGQGTTTITVKVGETSGTVLLKASNECGETSVGVLVTVTSDAPAIPGAISTTSPLCQGSTATLSVGSVAGATAYNWVVPTGWTITEGQGTESIQVTVGGSGVVKVNASNVCGTSADRELNVAPQPSTLVINSDITASKTTFCDNETNLSYSITTVTGATKYDWTVPTGWTITSGQGTTAIEVTAGTTNGEVKVTASNTCGASTSKSITVQPSKAPKAVAITGPDKPCGGTEVTYSVPAETGVTFTWDIPTGWTLVSGQGTNTLKVVPTTTAGSVSVKASNTCGTNAPVAYQVQPANGVPTAPGMIRGETNVCAGRPLTYNVEPAAGATSYEWTLPAGWSITSGQGTTSVQVMAGANSGIITIVAKNSCGTSLGSSMSVNSKPIAAPTAIIDRSSPCDGLVYEVSPVAGAVSYNWTVPAGWTITSGAGTNRIKVTAGSGSGLITVAVDNGNCTSESVNIMPNKELANTEISIPNVFSPNNDGNNDTWVVKNLENYTDNELTVFNRWGNEVFKAKAYNSGWNGNGLSEGTYFYTLRVKLCDGSDKVFKGYVMIVR